MSDGIQKKKGIKVDTKFKLDEKGKSSFGEEKTDAHDVHGSAKIVDKISVLDKITLSKRIGSTDGSLFGPPHIAGGTATGDAELQSLLDDIADFEGFLIYLTSASATKPFATPNKFYFCENAKWHPSPFVSQDPADSDADGIPDIEDPQITETVSKKGAVIDALSAQLQIPQNAVAEDVEVSVGVAVPAAITEPSFSDPTLSTRSNIVTLTPHGHQFAEPVLVSLILESPISGDAVLYGQATPADEWKMLDTPVSIHGDTASFQITSFSSYGIVEITDQDGDGTINSEDAFPADPQEQLAVSADPQDPDYNVGERLQECYTEMVKLKTRAQAMLNAVNENVSSGNYRILSSANHQYQLEWSDSFLGAEHPSWIDARAMFGWHIHAGSWTSYDATEEEMSGNWMKKAHELINDKSSAEQKERYDLVVTEYRKIREIWYAGFGLDVDDYLIRQQPRVNSVPRPYINYFEGEAGDPGYIGLNFWMHKLTANMSRADGNSYDFHDERNDEENSFSMSYYKTNLRDKHCYYSSQFYGDGGTGLLFDGTSERSSYSPIYNANGPYLLDPLADADHDGWADFIDEVPNDIRDHLDADKDGVGDTVDEFPNDPNEWIDNDNDNIGDNEDLDDDNDGLSDIQEAELGTDPLDSDTDNDWVSDSEDDLPLDRTETTDADGDGIGDNADTDDDNDGLSDEFEAIAGLDPLDPDTDDDGALDGADAFPLNPNETTDADDDGVGDLVDPDPTTPMERDSLYYRYPNTVERPLIYFIEHGNISWNPMKLRVNGQMKVDAALPDDAGYDQMPSGAYDRFSDQYLWTGNHLRESAREDFVGDNSDPFYSVHWHNPDYGVQTGLYSGVKSSTGTEENDGIVEINSSTVTKTGPFVVSSNSGEESDRNYFERHIFELYEKKDMGTATIKFYSPVPSPASPRLIGELKNLRSNGDSNATEEELQATQRFVVDWDGRDLYIDGVLHPDYSTQREIDSTVGLDMGTQKSTLSFNKDKMAPLLAEMSATFATATAQLPDYDFVADKSLHSFRTDWKKLYENATSAIEKSRTMVDLSLGNTPTQLDVDTQSAMEDAYDEVLDMDVQVGPLSAIAIGLEHADTIPYTGLKIIRKDYYGAMSALGDLYYQIYNTRTQVYLNGAPQLLPHRVLKDGYPTYSETRIGEVIVRPFTFEQSLYTENYYEYNDELYTESYGRILDPLERIEFYNPDTGELVEEFVLSDQYRGIIRDTSESSPVKISWDGSTVSVRLPDGETRNVLSYEEGSWAPADTDGDGVFDRDDVFPHDAKETHDVNLNERGDNADVERLVAAHTNGETVPFWIEAIYRTGSYTSGAEWYSKIERIGAYEDITSDSLTPTVLSVHNTEPDVAGIATTKQHIVPTAPGEPEMPVYFSTDYHYEDHDLKVFFDDPAGGAAPLVTIPNVSFSDSPALRISLTSGSLPKIEVASDGHYEPLTFFKYYPLTEADDQDIDSVADNIDFDFTNPHIRHPRTQDREFYFWFRRATYDGGIHHTKYRIHNAGETTEQRIRWGLTSEAPDGFVQLAADNYRYRTYTDGSGDHMPLSGFNIARTPPNTYVGGNPPPPRWGEDPETGFKNIGQATYGSTSDINTLFFNLPDDGTIHQMIINSQELNGNNARFHYNVEGSYYHDDINSSKLNIWPRGAEGTAFQVKLDGTTLQYRLAALEEVGDSVEIDEGSWTNWTTLAYPDRDRDGALDQNDAFPHDSSETADFDNDGTGDNADDDDDNDGTPDSEDAFPYDSTETADSDQDGIGDNADIDDDNLNTIADSLDIAAISADPTSTSLSIAFNHQQNSHKYDIRSVVSYGNKESVSGDAFEAQTIYSGFHGIHDAADNIYGWNWQSNITRNTYLHPDDRDNEHLGDVALSHATADGNPMPVYITSCVYWAADPDEIPDLSVDFGSGRISLPHDPDRSSSKVWKTFKVVRDPATGMINIWSSFGATPKAADQNGWTLIFSQADAE